MRRACIIWAGDTLGALDTPRIVSIGRELDEIDIFELEETVQWAAGCEIIKTIFIFCIYVRFGYNI